MVARGGIDLGGTKIQAVVVDGRYRVVGDARAPTPTKGRPRDVRDAIATTLGEAVASAGLQLGDLVGVGVGSPGAIDARKGTVSQAKNLPGWNGTYALGPELSKLAGAPVRLGNDVQVATDAEFHIGAAKPFDSVLGVFWGTGVGGGVVLDGKNWRGRGSGGEIGHIVVKSGGRRCPCGRRGCMEAYAGRAAMEARARALHKKGRKTDLFKIMKDRGRTRLTSGIWARAAKYRDRLALELLDEAVDALGVGVASACNLLDPEAVIIGGGLGVRFGEPYRKRIEQAMQPHLFTSANPPKVLLASLGDLGGAIGAALLVRELGGGRRRRAPRPKAPRSARSRRAA